MAGTVYILLAAVLTISMWLNGVQAETAVADPAKPLRCNVFIQYYLPNVTQPGVIPPEATLEECPPEVTMCMKRQVHVIQSEDKVGGTFFQWACATFGQYVVSGYKCGEKYELTIDEADFSSYSKTCLCCGDGCNNSTMDDQCNEAPVFTKKCHAVAKYTNTTEDSQLPSKDAALIPCTSTQSCSKYSTHSFETGISYFSWGCVSPRSGKCDWSESENTNNGTLLKKICSCCDDQCNGGSMDSIVATDTACVLAPQETSSAASTLTIPQAEITTSHPNSIRCHVFLQNFIPNVNQSGVLPDDAPLEECSLEHQMCIKRQVRVIEDGGEMIGSFFQWKCAAAGRFVVTDYQCNDRYEVTIDEVGFSSYTLTCHCCGDGCNNATMDDQCNEVPVFTKQCYGVAKTTQSPEDTRIPSKNVVVIPCTSTQSCTKYSSYSAETGVSYFSWGCASPRTGECDWTDAKYYNDGNSLKKICSCCGDLCNGAPLDSVAATDTRCNNQQGLTTSSAAPIHCNVFLQTFMPNVTQSGELPPEAMLQECPPEVSMCMKRQIHVIPNEGEAGGTFFQWGCATYGQFVVSDFTCGEEYELTFDEAGFNSYIKTCLCCGDDCNNPLAMDGKCNEAPVFTKKCYAVAKHTRVTEESQLPTNDATPIPCTSTESCMKYSIYSVETDLSYFSWGCATPKSGQCGWSKSEYSNNGTTLRKVCSCCGDRCNAVPMDTILASDTECKIEPVEPTPILPETTTSAPVAPLRCHVYLQQYTPNVHQTGELPPEAELQECVQGESKCMKRQVRVIENENGNEGTFFQWSCAPYQRHPYLNAVLQCDEEFEVSTNEGTFVTFTKTCFCCGDSCNNATMNSRCNEAPVFTKSCYGSSKYTQSAQDSSLPADATVVPCTASQSCVKYTTRSMDPELSFYRWGCASSMYGKCNFSHAQTDGSTFLNKGCSCCDGQCNGHEMDGIVSTDSSCEIEAPTPIRCYSYSEEYIETAKNTGELPGNAKLVECGSGKTMCQKSLNKLMTKAGERTYFTWGCSQLGQELTPRLSCGDHYETTITTLMDEATYSRRCLCCGDGCNNSTMDKECNEEPVFTKHCYSAMKEPERPDDSSLPSRDQVSAVPCTATQSCMKKSMYALKGFDLIFYQWFCASPPMKEGVCDYSQVIYVSSGEEETILNKVCACCGDLCNGAGMDVVLANDSKCFKQSPEETTVPVEPTTPSSSAPFRCSVHVQRYIPNVHQSGELPAEAVLQECPPDVTMCMKRQLRVVEKEGEVEGGTFFQWACATSGQFVVSDYGCNDQYELTFDEAGFSSYIKTCLCCGDGCNNATLDGQCNEAPVFTKQCYAVAKYTNSTEESQLPTKEAISIPCTSTESCMKYSTYSFETGLSYFSWGCASPASGHCDWSKSELSPDGTTLKKVCSCCGDLCNAGPMNSIVANDTECKIEPLEPSTTGAPDTALRCHVFLQQYTPNVHQTGELPPEAQLQECVQGESKCMKRQVRVIGNGEVAEGTFYQWSCAPFQRHPYLNAALQCDEKFEVSSNEGAFVSFTKTCLCCGDSCNNATMDGQCNEAPVFTKSCYGAAKYTQFPDQNNLPEDALVVPCTASQSCVKYSTHTVNPELSFYRWGCASAMYGKCDFSHSQTDNSTFLNKGCSCCDDLCNGHQMDNLISTDSSCDIQAPSQLSSIKLSSIDTATQPDETEEPITTAKSEPDVVVDTIAISISAVFGGSAVVLVVVLLITFFKSTASPAVPAATVAKSAATTVIENDYNVPVGLSSFRPPPVSNVANQYPIVKGEEDIYSF